MNMSVYRAATREAIKEIIIEESQSGRFGLLLSDESLESATDRICDFMETTLKLRSGVRERMERAVTETNASPAATPTTTPTLVHRLPRTRVPLSDNERNVLRTR
jgi:hypothetical protein